MSDISQNPYAHAKNAIAVIGNGLAGLTAALSLGKSGQEVFLCAPKAKIEDNRSTALLAQSVELFEKLSLWDKIESHASSLKIMRIIDDTNRLVRAPQTDFVASEIDLPAFGYNVLNMHIAKIITDELTNMTNVTIIEKSVTEINNINSQKPILIFDDNSKLEVHFIAAADGRNSQVRQSLEIETSNWHYPQIALVANLSHSLPHNQISTEFHTATGPLTLVPLGKNKSSLVCVVDKETANSLLGLKKQDLDFEIEQRMQSILGKIDTISPLQSFPLSGMKAEDFGKYNAVLIGEAAHVLPPIGAQGYNLALRDVECLTELINSNPKLDFASIATKYSTARHSDIQSRTISVDLLNRSLLTSFLPVQLARSLGLYTLGQVGPMRRFMMREGISPGSGAANIFKQKKTDA